MRALIFLILACTATGYNVFLHKVKHDDLRDDPPKQPPIYSQSLLENSRSYASGRQITCTKALSCFEYDRIRWKKKQIQARQLASASSNYSLSTFSELCQDVQSAPFLLEEGSENWPMACLWTGSDDNATCAPGPPSNEIIDYISPKIWRSKLEDFRQKIGCNKYDIIKARSANELYFCRKRCTESGIGYFPSLVMAASFLTIVALIVSDN